MSGGKGGSVPKIPSYSENVNQRNPITWYKARSSSLASISGTSGYDPGIIWAIIAGVSPSTLEISNSDGTYPSNVQTWWSMKRPVQATPDNLQKTYLEVFDPATRFQMTYGNTLAPKGHYIFDAFKIDRSSESDVPGLEVEHTRGQRPRAVAFYAGRVFYAGVRASKWGSRIYFSQVLERPDDQVGSCHQNQDPTSEDVPDLLPTDGGVIVIPELGDIVKLFAFATGLFVFAQNGVWQISGPDGGGFKANDYSVSRISKSGAFGPHSFVETEQGLLWWNRNGIWALAPDQTGLNMTVTSLTDRTIKEFMEGIPDESKKYAKGAYNHQTKIVQWIYRAEAPTTISEQYGYNRILNLDTRSGAFYPWRPISSTYESSFELSGIISVVGDAAVEAMKTVMVEDKTVVIYDIDEVAVVEDMVYANTFQVMSGDNDSALTVMSPSISYVSIQERFKYLMVIKEIV